ncbi:MAG: ricin-type beta-trefoil lectin domain protein [Alcanivoracaceae bacterium]|nr:ricin-type beta-trefoil lectin domain protein [Alcanivoracaceae bacterium]
MRTPMSLAGLLLGALLSLAATAADLSQGINDQYRLALDTPINRMQILGAHNAWNDGGNPWNNQRLPLTRLMDLGIRNVDLDVHMDGGEAVLCHSDCGAIYAARDSYPQELGRIRSWLDNNPQGIVFIDIEDRAHNQSAVEGPLYSTFGNLLYTPADKPASGWPTPRQMIASGKRVIVKSANDTYDGSLIFPISLFAEGASGGWNSRQVKYFNGSNCTVNDSAINQALIYALSDSKLGKDWLPDGWVDETGTIDSGNIPAIVRCGIDIIDADRWDEGMVSASIWSWAGGEPNNYGSGEHCAHMRSDGRWNDNRCDASYRYACQSDSNPDDWRLSSGYGAWGNGKAVCASELPGFSFAAPANGYMNDQLRQMAGGQNVWINFTDQASEGEWESYQYEKLGWNSGAYGNNEDRAETLRKPGAKAIRVSLSGETEANYDFVYVYDGNRNLVASFHGALNTSVVVPDDTAIVRLRSDGSVTRSGVTATVSEAGVTNWTTGAYGNNEDRNETLSIPGAAALKVYVNGETELNYDFITFYDANGNQVQRLHGPLDTSFIVNGDSVRARLTSDGSVTKGGVSISIKAAAPYVFRKLVNGKGKCLDVESQSTSNGSAIHHWSCHGEDSQLWYMDPDGLLRNKMNPMKCADAEGGGTSKGTDVHLWDCHGGNNQRWVWQGDTLRITSNTSMALDISDAAWGAWNGQDAHLWTYHGGWGQRWRWE